MLHGLGAAHLNHTVESCLFKCCFFFLTLWRNRFRKKKKKFLDLESGWLICAFLPHRKFRVKHDWEYFLLRQTSLLTFSWASNFLLHPEYFPVPCRMDLLPKEKHLCHTPKNYIHFFTSLGLHFTTLTNWHLRECYCAFWLPSTHSQLEFKINPVKF